jgi:hypothetical protein
MGDGRLLTRQYTPGGVRWSVGGRHVPEAIALRICKCANIEVADPGLFTGLAQTFRIRK